MAFNEFLIELACRRARGAGESGARGGAGEGRGVGLEGVRHGSMKRTGDPRELRISAAEAAIITKVKRHTHHCASRQQRGVETNRAEPSRATTRTKLKQAEPSRGNHGRGRNIFRSLRAHTECIVRHSRAQ